jgi:serine/threonine protein kinase
VHWFSLLVRGDWHFPRLRRGGARTGEEAHWPRRMFKKKSGKSRDTEILESLDRDPLDVGGSCRIEDFEQLEVIGTGTFGHVRLCKHKASGQHFALKVQRKHDVIRLKQIEHVLSEKKILQAMDHPFIVRMPAAFQDSRNLYMVLELVIGGEVFLHLRKAGRFSNETSRIYAAQIVLAICHLHEHNVVYRDLKPENILLDEKGFLKITDFGATIPSRSLLGFACNKLCYAVLLLAQGRQHLKAQPLPR